MIRHFGRYEWNRLAKQNLAGNCKKKKEKRIAIIIIKKGKDIRISIGYIDQMILYLRLCVHTYIPLSGQDYKALQDTAIFEFHYRHDLELHTLTSLRSLDSECHDVVHIIMLY